MSCEKAEEAGRSKRAWVWACECEGVEGVEADAVEEEEAVEGDEEDMPRDDVGK